MEGAHSCSAASRLSLALVLLDRSRRRRVQARRGDDARHESAALTSDVVSLLSLQIHDRRSPSTVRVDASVVGAGLRVESASRELGGAELVGTLLVRGS